MKLKELKQLVAEEYNKYMSEQDPMDDMGLPTAAGAPADPTIAVSDKDINLDGGDEDAEATLRDIYEMLKDFFEWGAADDAGSDDANDADDEEMTEGKKDDDDKMEEGKDDDDKKEEAKQLQERFQKLANIIK